MDATPSQRRPVVAALLALLCHGLGHLYAGRTAAAVAIHLASLATAAALWLAMGAGLERAALAGAVALAVWLGQAVLAFRAAKATAAPRGWLSRPVGLILFYVATLLGSTGLRTALAPYAPRTYSTGSGAMIPTLRIGDWLVAVPGSRPQRGDVVVHAAPPSAPDQDPQIKRVVAVGGDTVEVREGRLVLNGAPVQQERSQAPCTYDARGNDGTWRPEPCVGFVESIGARAYETSCTPSISCGDVAPQVVPAGHVFLLGDHRDHSADSRVYGPVPEERIIGRAAWVYWSFGPSGIRWDRVGAAVR